MSLKKNILANYIGQFYVALIGIFLVPLYVKYMGAEAYGLVAFYAMLQTWFFMLDMGLSPMISREAARYQAGAIDALHLRRLVRILEIIFLIIALIGAAVIILSSDFIANKWLNVNELSINEVQLSISIMAVIISLRWMGGLYRSAITGFEHIVWLNRFNVIIATLRFIGVVPILIYVDSAPSVFFGYQLVVAIIEFLISFNKIYRLLPFVNIKQNQWDWKPLRLSLRFSVGVAFTSIVWVVVTQSDKLLLSSLMSLVDYAYFTLAVLLASGVLIISKPISGAILPRMTSLYAQNKYIELKYLYKNATQFVSVISIPAVLVLSVFPEQVLFAWTGSQTITNKSSMVLALYAVGNGIMVLTAFPYYLQYANGNLKLHLIWNAIFIIFFIPTIYYSVINFGMTGAGYAWVASNLLLFLFYLPIVHKKYLKGLHLRWLLFDILQILILPFLYIIIVKQLVEWPSNRVLLSLYILFVLFGAFILAAFSSNKVRGFIYNSYTDRSGFFNFLRKASR